MRKDLLSPNEYIRGRTLRLVSKIHIKGTRWFELLLLAVLETLMQAIIENLTHRHFYVRRNAIMCLYAIYSHLGAELVEDATEAVDALLLNETDLTTKRNSFLLLFHLD